MKRFFWAVALLVLCTSLFAVAPFNGDGRDGVERLPDYGVRVQYDKTCGSGVLFVNKDKVFVWTNAHVVGGAVTVTLNETTGEGFIQLKSPTVSRWILADGTETVDTPCSIVRYHPHYDLALLRMDKKAFNEKSVKFAKKSPKLGEPLWHLGGPEADNLGVYPHKIARLNRKSLGYTYDQTSGALYPGCSGGGFFRVGETHKDTECVGLMTQYAHIRSHGIALHIPARVMWSFSEKYGCLWAMDDSVPVPETDLFCPYCLD